MHKTILSLGIGWLIFLSNALALNAADELTQLLYNTNTMQAEFTQTSAARRGGSDTEKIRGVMYIDRPGKFRWEITAPVQQLIIINDKQLFLYDPGLEQLMKNSIDYRRPGNPALLLSSSPHTLAKLFIITKLRNGDTKAKTSCFKLQPKVLRGQELEYKEIKLCFFDTTLAIMQVVDNLEQTSTISFSNVVKNAKITARKFVFIPPPHTEIINNL